MEIDYFMLLEIGIGDAYGAGFEFSPYEKIKAHNSLTSYQSHELGIPAGNYTDDTQMSLAISELLIDKTDWNRQNIANKFVQCFKRDPREGYSKGFYYFLKSIKDGREFLEKINPESTRNGAAMRAAPLGIIKDIDDLLAMSEIQASLTHNTEIGIKSSQAVSLAAHFFVYNIGSKNVLFDFIGEYTNFKWNNKWEGEVACCGEETVNALLTVLDQSNSLKDVLINSVAFGGDVDTVAAVGLGIANLSSEFEKELPNFLFNDLENNTFGREYLKEVGSQLLSLKA
ncbi:ADP-ribosylglycohydrolase family protein [Litoribacillus peritrichatus]|uniref:ADP-ribosyl-[dinitrogen reductase] hydrolase n=1 Tax=Litoribacillus peritrichatus TaxID=718191 RepID=A0ABP7N4J5_9GAMM